MRFKLFFPLLAIVLIAHYAVLNATFANFSLKFPSSATAWNTRNLQQVAAPQASARLQNSSQPALTPRPQADPQSVPPAQSAPPQTQESIAPAESAALASAHALAHSMAVEKTTATAIDTPSFDSKSIAVTTPTVAALDTMAAASVPRTLREASGGTGIGATAAYKIPASATLRFVGTGSSGSQPLQASGLLQWRHDGTQYEAKLEAGALFFTALTQTSVGAIGPLGLMPVRFLHKTRSEQAAHFERDAGRISFSNQKSPAPLLNGAQDRLSILLQLAALLAGQAPNAARAITYTIQTASATEADQWLFTVEGDEMLSLPAGNQLATKLQRMPRNAYDDLLEIWFAPSLGYLPVRIRQTQAKGDVTDLQLRNASSP